MIRNCENKVARVGVFGTEGSFLELWVPFLELRFFLKLVVSFLELGVHFLELRVPFLELRDSFLELRDSFCAGHCEFHVNIMRIMRTIMLSCCLL